MTWQKVGGLFRSVGIVASPFLFRLGFISTAVASIRSTHVEEPPGCTTPLNLKMAEPYKTFKMAEP
jgi:hypothetical protein